MQVIFLYAAVVLIWGSTWSAIPYQLGDVAAELSVAYRFGIAAILLYIFALVTRRKLALPAYAYPFVFLQGLLLFCVNYFLVYYGTAYITSGLVAVVFSSVVVFNAIFERIFFRSALEARVLLAAAIGFTGIAMIFWPEISSISLKDDTVVGILYVLTGTVIASLGNMAAVINTRRALPVVAVNAHSMAWAGVTSLGIAALLGREFTFATNTGYIVSLAFLALFGSAVAFGCYLALIRRIGAPRAAYSAVAFPVIALGISTVVEGYEWTGVAAIGIMLTLIGNWLILKRSKKTINKTES
jgi:drug/metabolite transporter (DMT)-like permease